MFKTLDDVLRGTLRGAWCAKKARFQSGLFAKKALDRPGLIPAGAAGPLAANTPPQLFSAGDATLDRLQDFTRPVIQCVSFHAAVQTEISAPMAIDGHSGEYAVLEPPGLTACGGTDSVCK